jgi:hypothetical protein
MSVKYRIVILDFFFYRKLSKNLAKIYYLTKDKYIKQKIQFIHLILKHIYTALKTFTFL